MGGREGDAELTDSATRRDAVAALADACRRRRSRRKGDSTAQPTQLVALGEAQCGSWLIGLGPRVKLEAQLLVLHCNFSFLSVLYV